MAVVQRKPCTELQFLNDKHYLYTCTTVIHTGRANRAWVVHQSYYLAIVSVSEFSAQNQESAQKILCQ